MFKWNMNKLTITKGDSGALSIDMRKQDGSSYEMAAGDTLTFTARRTVGALVLLSITSTTNRIVFTPDKTKMLEVGPCVFDIELSTATGDKFTLVGPLNSTDSNLNVLPEVTE